MTNFLKQRELEREEILKEIGNYNKQVKKSKLWCPELVPSINVVKATLRQHDKDTEQFKKWKEKLKEKLKIEFEKMANPDGRVHLREIARPLGINEVHYRIEKVFEQLR